MTHGPAVAVGLAAVLASVVSSVGGASSQVAPAAAPTSAAVADHLCGSLYGQPAPAWEHVTVIVFENKKYSQIIGNTTDAPYLASLAQACGRATNMNHMTATSLTNYIAMTSGYTGHTNGKEVLITGTKLPPVWPQDSVSIFEALGSDAREWAESMPSNCYMRSVGDFHVGHTPYQYYVRTQGTLCPQYAIPLTAASNPMSARYNLVIPNKAHDMHGTDVLTTSTARIRAGDAWASTFIPTLLASAEYQSKKSAIIITWDEASAKTSLMPFIVVSPYTQAGGVTNVRYDHYSTLKGIQQMLGMRPEQLLGHAADPGRPSIADDPVFGL
jgi:phosphatidylinositol-3-phosphatase